MIKYEYDSCAAPLDMLSHMMNAKSEAGWETWKVRVWGSMNLEALLIFRRPVGWYAPEVERARRWARLWKRVAKDREEHNRQLIKFAEAIGQAADLQRRAKEVDDDGYPPNQHD
jgi:hypothetical protein